MSELDVLKVQPDQIDIKKAIRWTTLSVRLGVGEQSSPLQTRPLIDLTFTYRNHYSVAEIDELLQFFNDRKGGHQAFIVPSWIKDGRLTTNYVIGASTLGVTHTHRFTASPASISNFVVVGKKTGPFTWHMSTSRISSIASNMLYLTTPFSNTFAADDFVYVGYKVKFQDDTLLRSIIAGEAYISEAVNLEGVY